MPIPDPPPDEVTVGAVTVALFRQLHGELRDAVSGLDHAGLNFVPCDGANSIATIVTHLLGSEAETIRCVAGVAATRDRASEFMRGEQESAEVLAQIAEADRLLDGLAPSFTPERLESSFPLPTLPEGEVRPGITWLIGNLGHAREHVGHVLLTRQLCEAQRSRSSSAG